MDLYFTFEFRNYLELFIKPSAVKPYSNKAKVVTPVINSRRKYEEVAVMAHVFQKY